MNPIRNCCKQSSSMLIRSYSSFSNPLSRRVTEVFHDTPRILNPGLVRTRRYSTQSSSNSSFNNKFIVVAGALTLYGVGAYIYNQTKNDDLTYCIGDELTIPRDIVLNSNWKTDMRDIIELMVKRGDEKSLIEILYLLRVKDHFENLNTTDTQKAICQILIENREMQLIRNVLPLLDKKIFYSPNLLNGPIIEGDLKLLKVLIELGVPLSRDYNKNIIGPDQKDDHLLTAVLSDQMVVVEFLLKYGFKINEPSPISTLNIFDEGDVKITPAFLAVYKNKPETLKKLLDLGADISLGDKYNPLIYSIRHGNKECFRVMVQQGFNLNFTNVKGQTPLMVAAEIGRNDMVVRLLESGAYPKCVDNDENTLWAVAATSSRLANDQIWTILKERIPLTIDSVNKEGLTPLLQAISQFNSEAVKALIEHGASTTFVLKLDQKSCTAMGFKPGEEITAIQFTQAIMEIVTKDYRFKYGQVDSQVKNLELQKIMQILSKSYRKYFNEDISPGSR